MTRRVLLQSAAGAAASGSGAGSPFTEFQIACMTWPYVAFPFERALKGIAAAGYRYVALGPWHKDAAGNNVPVIAPDAAPSRARQVLSQCADLGLEPVMMFGITNLEDADALDVYRRRIEQAHAGRVPFILSFGNPQAKPGAGRIWVRNLQALGPEARQAGVTIAIKQHGGPSATGRQCAEILREVNDQGVLMFYDSGNTRHYADVDPVADLPACAPYIRGFAIKDFRGEPRRTTCGPGFGEVDHFRLLLPVARTGLKMPLACETLFEPYVQRPATPEAVDALARRAREFLETVTRGIRAAFSA